MLYHEVLTLEQFNVTGMQKSAEGIVVWDQAKLFRHSTAKAGATDKPSRTVNT
jgi:hypothetical protein